MHDHGRLHPHHRDQAATEPLSEARRRIALAVLCLCALTAGVDLTITNVALPFIGRALDAPINELQWAVDAYNIVLAGLLVLGGALADRYGRRRIFLLSYALFALASLAAAFSPTAGALIGARALMGVGGAGITAPALAIISSMYGPDERGRAIGAFVVFGASGLAVGPIAGGLLLDHFWWGSVFLVNVPVVVAGVIAGALVLPPSRAPVPATGPAPLDLGGAVLSVVGLGALLFGVIEGPGRGWSAPEVIAGLAVGAVSLTLFVVHALRSAAPLFDVRILRLPAVAAGASTLVMAYLLLSAFLFIGPQYLQDVRAQSVVVVGLLFVPFAVVFGISSLQAQRVVQRIGPRAAISLGLASSAAASLVLALTTGGPLWLTVAGSVLLGVALSLLIAPPSTVVMNALPEESAGDGSSLNFVSRFVGASVGVAVVGSVIAARYTADLTPSLASLGPARTEKAQGSLQGALEVAQDLPRSAAGMLTRAARDAFDHGATTAYLVVAGLAVVATLVAWVGLGRTAHDEGQS